MYINSYPQYDPDMSYHGYDLSRDVSEYKFDADNHIDPSSLGVNLSIYILTFIFLTDDI